MFLSHVPTYQGAQIRVARQVSVIPLLGIKGKETTSVETLQKNMVFKAMTPYFNLVSLKFCVKYKKALNETKNS